MRWCIRLQRLMILLAGSAGALLEAVRDACRHTYSVDFIRTSYLYPRYLNRGNAMEFCRYDALRYCSGRGLDIGSSEWPFPGARGIEFSEHENALNIREQDASQDFIFSSHCLEHLEPYETALDEWTRVLKPGGMLYLYLPHPVCSIWSPKINRCHRWQPEPAIVVQELSRRGYEIVDATYMPDSYLSFKVVGRKAAASA